MNAPVNSHAGNDYAAKLAAQSRTPKEHLVDNKVYYHHHNYAKFHLDFGGSNVKTISFANHRYITDDKREQDQLDLVADYPGTFIYTIPDNEIARAEQLEIARQTQEGVLKAAAAQSADRGQNFDPNVPIIPIVTNVQQNPGMHITPVPVQQGQPQAPQAVAVVGMQNSLSGTQATEDLKLSTPPVVTPPSAADAATARLNAMTAATKSP
jgi:hypothetical protein